MKVSYSGIIEKFDRPARAVISAEVIELEDGENFDQETMRNVVKEHYEEVAGHLRYANFFGHRTFQCIFNFTYEGKELSISRQCVTENV